VLVAAPASLGVLLPGGTQAEGNATSAKSATSADAPHAKAAPREKVKGLFRVITVRFLPQPGCWLAPASGCADAGFCV
jgi:hypothetical protein